MINRDKRGHSYCGVRGEILGSPQDELLRKHLSRMFSLVKNESQRREDDQKYIHFGSSYRLRRCRLIAEVVLASTIVPACKSEREA